MCNFFFLKFVMDYNMCRNEKENPHQPNSQGNIFVYLNNSSAKCLPDKLSNKLSNYHLKYYDGDRLQHKI